ncbi:MAG TPA: hypothetical protein VM659_11650 [Dongiaceae bacterium]|nr:hypothetical protein [Dongiaceae bacterium]
MTWLQFSHGLWLDPVAQEPPGALVVLLRDAGDSVAALTPVVARWAKIVPTTAFAALQESSPPDLPARGLPPQGRHHAGVVGETSALDHAVHLIEPQLEELLRFYQIDASRLVLVGFGYGGTLALRLLLRWSCAGALTFAARLIRPLPRIIRIDGKVRLIECADAGLTGHGNMREVVTSLAARGVDVRGVVLPGPALSEEAIRHGGAYLGELVATAQQGRRFHVAEDPGDDA